MAVSCESVSVAPPTFTVRDSAGVQIVESTAPAWAPEEAWTVSGEPAVHIGVIDGHEEYQFTFIAGVWRVPDGGFVVADRGSTEIRFFGADGIFRGSFGKRGDGPGEFARLLYAYPYRGDSIAVWDDRVYSIYDRDGQFGRSQTLALDPPRPASAGGTGAGFIIPGWPIGMFPDGTLLALRGVIFQLIPGEPVPREVTFLRLSAEGDSLQGVGPFPGGVWPIEDPRVRSSVRLVSPFDRVAASSPSSAGLYVGASRDFEIQRFRSDGMVDLVIRASHRSLVLTEEHRDMFEDRERERLAGSASPQEFARALAAVEFPETVPPYSQLVVDSEDHLWVRDYKMGGTPGPQTWSVFAPEGQLLGTLETPERLQVRQIEADFILGIWTDELDVSYIRMYALERG